MTRSAAAKVSTVGSIVLLVIVTQATRSEGITVINPDLDKAATAASAAAVRVALSGAGNALGANKPLVSAVGQHQVYRLVSGSDRKQAAGVRPWAPPPVVYIPHANFGSAQIGSQQQQQPITVPAPLYQPLVGPIATPPQPVPYRVVRIYRPPAATLPTFGSPPAPPAAVVAYRQPPPPAPVLARPAAAPAQIYRPPPLSTLPPAPVAPSPPPAAPAVQPPPVVPAYQPAPTPVFYPAPPSPPAVSIPDPIYQPPTVQATTAATTEENQCPSVRDEPCQSLSAGLYAHPSATTCYIQCDEFGQTHVRPCAPGTRWKSDLAPSQIQQPSLFNMCS